MRRLSALCVASVALAACANVWTRQAPAPSTDAVEASVLIARVNHALMSGDIDGYADLTIAVEDGVVCLDGVLPSQQLVERSKEIARAVPGVEAVFSRITVASGTR